MLFTNRTMATLKEHEKLCELRYASVEKRLEHLETKIDEIHATIDGFRDFIIKLAVKSALGIFTLVCAAVFVIKL